MTIGLLAYADHHAHQYDGSPVGDDYILGPCWVTMAKSILDLLNGETGRLDCGTLDQQIRRFAAANGVDLS